MLTRRHHRGGEVWTLSVYNFLILSVGILPFLPACSTLKKVETVEVIKTETQVRDSLVLRDTTIYVPIPLEKDQAIVQVGDTSRRETTVAQSLAWVGTDGFLHHTLENKRGHLTAQLVLPEHILTTTVQNTRDKSQVITREVKVEKRLNWWQRFRIGAFWWLLALAAFAWRKPIIAAAKKVIGLIW